MPILIELFNLVLGKNISPDYWLTGIINQIYKKKVDADELDCMTRLFADDTSLGFNFKQSEILNLEMNRNLRKLNIWAKDWLISYNPYKTESLIFTLKKRNYNVNLIFDEKLILNRLAVTNILDVFFHQMENGLVILITY